MSRSWPEIRVHTSITNRLWDSFEVKMRLSSLAALYRAGVDSFDGVNTDYLRVKEGIEDISELSMIGENKVIGIAWKGGLDDTVELQRRSIQINLLFEVLKGRKAHILALQHGECDEDIQWMAKKGLDIKKIEKLHETERLARVVSRCDAIVTCEQTICHIAGSLGKKCLVFLGNPRGWRYFSRDDKTSKMAWYKNVTLVEAGNYNMAREWLDTEIGGPE